MLGNTPESLFQLFKRSKRTLYTNLRFFCRVPISDCRPSRDISRSPQEPQHKTSTRQDSSLPQRLSRLLTTLPASRQEDYKIKPQQSLQIDVPNSETGTHSLTTFSSLSILSVGENLGRICGVLMARLCDFRSMERFERLRSYCRLRVLKRLEVHAYKSNWFVLI